MTATAQELTLQVNMLPILDAITQLGLSAHLNGSQGSNRLAQERCHLQAHTDVEAIYCWLKEYQQTATTLRLYQKEAERFLLWCLFQRQKPLSSINRDDMDGYIAFLGNPQPTVLWCGKGGGRSYRRGSASWKPFTGPLSMSSQRTALSAVDSLFGYLVQARYCDVNPMGLMRKRVKSMQGHEERRLQVEQRVLEPDVWSVMIDTLHNFPEVTTTDKNEKERLRFIVYLLYFLGLRNNECCTHTFGSFRHIKGDWWFLVKGKGDKCGRIPVNDELLTALQRYRVHFRMPPLPTPEDTTPLIIAWRHHQSLSPRYVNTLLKRLSAATAERFRNDEILLAKLKRFSAHWLRHQSATMQDYFGVAKKHIKANHRHENEQTTDLYIHALDKNRHVDMQKLTIHSVTNRKITYAAWKC